MTQTLRRSRLAAATLLALTVLAAQGQTEAPAPATPASPPLQIEPGQPPTAPAPATMAKPSEAVPKKPASSAMTAQLFYEVLMGELNARTDPGAAYSLVLDAARRARDDKLFQRAVEIALKSRAGDSALMATRAWKESLPESREARRLELQLLITLNRIAETVEPLRAEVAATPEIERPRLMSLIVGSYARVSDKKLAASVVEKALAEAMNDPATGAAAWAAIGRLRLAAGESAGALDAATKGQLLDLSADGPALLALEMMGPGQPLAEPIVKRYLAGPQAQAEIRVGYARALVDGRRYAEAANELTATTVALPELPEPWLLLGSLQLQARQDQAAEASLNQFIALAPTLRDAEGRARGLAQAYLQLARLAERRKDFAGADGWLARIDSSIDPLGIQTRRAALLARQGKLSEALEGVQSLPEGTAEEKKQKFLTELQLLREAKQYQAAFDRLTQASAAAPNDTDLIYDQAMVAEKLNRLDEMERLLRRLIALKPKEHNAYNALGYSLADRKLRLEEARLLIQKAIQLAPDDPYIADSLGWVEYRLGHTSEAVRILEDAYKRRPDPEIGAHLGEVLWEIGERERALAIWKEAFFADADNETLQETLKRLRVNL